MNKNGGKSDDGMSAKANFVDTDFDNDDAL